MLSVGVAPMIHALALAIDAAAGTGRGRTLQVTAAPVPGAIELALHSSPLQAPTANGAVAIAGFVIARDGGGRLWCTASGDQMVIRLPVG
jgi:6,7-dimethyl-8-ribityllumazine synthase